MQRARTIESDSSEVSQTLLTVTLCKMKAPPRPGEMGEKGKQLCHSWRSLAKHKVLLKLLTKIVKHFLQFNIQSDKRQINEKNTKK